MSRQRHPLATAAAASPDHPMLVTDERAWSAASLLDAVARCAGTLTAAGLQPGDRVALVGDLDSHWVIALHAIRWMGGVAVPLPHNDPALGSLLDAAAVRVLLAADTVAVDHPSVLPLIAGDASPAGEWFGSMTDDQLVLLTSGTTGTPRPVPLTVGQLWASAMGSAERLGHRADDAWLCCLPPHHIGGLSVLLRTAIYGTTAIVHPRFDPARVATALDDGTVSQVSLVPAMLARVLDARAEAPMPPSVRTVLVGGAAMPPDLLDRCRALALPLAITWGMTEVGSQAATRAPGDLRPALDCGYPLPGATVEIEDGELVITGGIAPNGRFPTGDRGHLDASGRVVVSGRGDQLIVSGGENIDPVEIEAALEMHPAIRAAAVVPRRDAEWGHRPVAFVVAADSPVPDEILRQHLGAHLQRFKIPDAFYWRSALPRGPAGKVRRSRLEAQAMGGFDEV
jgi:O-succinylbenzoic acid--CoA ligase